MVGPAKRKFLVTHDTGKGHPWAESEGRVRRESPGLQVVELAPDRARRQEIAETMDFHVDDERDAETLRSFGGRCVSGRSPGKPGGENHP